MKLRFHDVRIEILTEWEAITRRKLYSKYSSLSNDDYSGSYECKWQEMYNEGHVHVFCCIGEWANNITDILLDCRYDHLYLTDEDYSNDSNTEIEAVMLFRYYTRFLLVVSEFITDFEEIVNQFLGLTSKEIKDKKSRSILSGMYIKNNSLKIVSNANEKDEIYNAVNELMKYINTICKHKFGSSKKKINIHKINDHLPYKFQFERDFEELYNFNKSFESKEIKSILVPNIDLVFDIISNCYCIVDSMFTDANNRDKFRDFCKKNSD